MTKTDERLAVPAKPLAITAVNVAALAAAGVATGGTVWVAAAGAAAVGAVALGSKAKKKASAKRSSSPSKPSGASSSARKGSSGLKSGSPKGKGSVFSARKAKSKPLAAGAPPRKSAQSKKNGLGSPRLSPKGSVFSKKSSKPATHSSLGKSSKAAGKSGSRFGLGKTRSSKASPMSNFGKKSPMLTSRRGGVQKSSTAKPSLGARAKKVFAAKTSQARKAAWAGTKKHGKSAWTKARGAFRSRVMGRHPIKVVRKVGKQIEGSIATREFPRMLTARKPVRPALNLPSPFAHPMSKPTVTVRSTNPNGASMIEHARRMTDWAADFDAPGVLEIIDEVDANLPGSLNHVAEAFDLVVEKFKNKWPIDDAIAQKLSMASELIWTASSVAKGAVDDIEVIHAEELRKLRDPSQPGAEKWDLTANGKA